MTTSRIVYLFLIAVFIGFTGCNGNKEHSEDDIPQTSETPQKGGTILFRIKADPGQLNRLKLPDGTTGHIVTYTHQYLININPATVERIPQLAKGLPEISEDGLTFTYEIKEEATWPDGTPVTGKDYEFTMKLIKNPTTGLSNFMDYYVFVKDVIVDENNPRKVSVVVDDRFHLAEIAVAGFSIQPRHIWDPDNLMAAVTVRDFYEDAEAASQNPKVVEFAELFASEPYSIDPAKLIGSGPYKITNYKPDESITMERVENWWGEKVDSDAWFWKNYPDKIIFKVIPEMETAQIALKSQEIDVLTQIIPENFNEYKEEGNIVSENYNFHSPTMLAYTYLAMNNRPSPPREKFFTDKRVRWAIAHLTDPDVMIGGHYKGYAKRVVSPVPMTSTKEYNHDLEPVPHNIEKARTLLAEAGWEDTNGNGILDKEINGRKVEFSFEINISPNHNASNLIANQLKKAAEEVGIEVKIAQKKFADTQADMKAHDYDMAYSGSGLPAFSPDFKESWHTDSWVHNGGNYSGFGTPESDSIIIAIRKELDSEKRLPLYMRIQEIIYDDQPVVFLVCPQERIASHKKLKGGNVTGSSPFILLNTFWQEPTAE